MNTQRKFTPETILELQENEIFVFGSNINGNHAGGAAKTAVDKFGAIEGQAVGLQGQSYAIPTLDENMQKLSLDEISRSIDALYNYANEHVDFDFYVTKIGCGIAGFKEEEISTLFKLKEFQPFNVFLPMEFTLIRGVKGFDSDMKCRNMKFKENKTFHQDGDIECCKNGLHFCENPLDVKQYYSNDGENLFCEVEGQGKIDTHNKDSKIAVSELKVKTNISWLNAIKIGIDFTLKRATFIVGRSENKGLSLSSKILEKAEEEIKKNKDSNILAGRNSNTLAGRNSNTLAGRNSNTLAGQDSNTLAGQDSNTLAGRNSNTLAGQDSNTLAGQDSNVIACRFDNIIDLSGTNNVVVAANNSKIRGKIGNAICLVEFDDDKNIVAVKSAIIDGEELKENTFYMLKNGKFTKAEETNN